MIEPIHNDVVVGCASTSKRIKTGAVASLR